MEIKEIQNKVKDYFERGHFKVWPKFVVLARLEEEISEIARIISVVEGYREKSKIGNMDIEDEFGDALFQLIHLGNICNVDFSKAIQKTFKKYQKYIESNKDQNQIE